MSQLEANTVSLQSILSAVNALPDAGSGGGGGSVETCTVSISCFDSENAAYAYSAYENGQIVAKGSTSGFESNPLVITNVVCGSAIYINNNYYMNGVTVGGGATAVTPPTVLGIVCQAPVTAGAFGTIDIYDDD